MHHVGNLVGGFFFFAGTFWGFLYLAEIFDWLAYVPSHPAHVWAAAAFTDLLLYVMSLALACGLCDYYKGKLSSGLTRPRPRGTLNDGKCVQCGEVWNGRLLQRPDQD